MKYKNLLVEIKYGIGIVWMNRPDLHNVFDDTMTSELMAAMRALEGDPAVRAVVLAAAGTSFCAGTDVRWLRRRANNKSEKNRSDGGPFAAMLHCISTLKKPTIARVHGPAISCGVGLVAACDIAFAACEAEFCLSEVRFGLIPAMIGPYVIRAMGERAARRYVLSGEVFTAAEAYRIGLINDIAPLVELDARINELLGHLILGGANAQAQAKEWIRTVAGSDVHPDLIKESVKRFDAACDSEEGREGIRALTEKRSPAWSAPTPKSAAKKGAARKSKRPLTAAK
jgi:methylglutaconyl-CoA hydratase